MKEEPTAAIVERLAAQFPALKGAQRLTLDATAHHPMTPRLVATKDGTVLSKSEEPYVVPAGEICACFSCEVFDAVGGLTKRLACARRRGLMMPAVRGSSAAWQPRRG